MVHVVLPSFYIFYILSLCGCGNIFPSIFFLFSLTGCKNLPTVTDHALFSISLRDLIPLILLLSIRRILLALSLAKDSAIVILLS